MPLDIPRHWRSVRFELAIALIAASGVALALYSTSLGIGTDADSATYLMTAQSVLAGKGLTHPAADGSQIPMTSFPPLLPIVLAAFGLIGLDPLAGARWLHALLFGVEILLAGFLIRRYTQSGTAAAFGAFLLASTVDVLLNHSLLLSEPLFLVFVLAGLTAVALYVERPSFPLLFLFSVAFALGSATRYAGASLLPIGAAAIVFGARPSRHRWVHLSVFLAIFGTPLAVWGLRNLNLVHALSNRSLAFHPPDLNRFIYSYLSLSTWVLPSVVPPLLRVLVLSAALLLLFRPFVPRLTKNIRQRWSFHELSAMFVACYVLLLVISQTFFDTQIWIAGRHLLPVYLVGVIIVVCQGKELLDKSTRFFRAAGMVLCLALAGAGTVRIAKNAIHSHNQGLGLASVRWQTSELTAKLRELDANMPLFSNSRSAVYLLTGRVAQGLPNHIDSQTERSRPEYSAELDRMRRQLQKGGGAVVVFTAFAAFNALVPESELQKELGLRTVAITDEGYLMARSPETNFSALKPF